MNKPGQYWEWKQKKTTEHEFHVKNTLERTKTYKKFTTLRLQ